MPYFDYDGEINVDVNDFLSALSVREKKELIDKLITNGDVSRTTLIGKTNDIGISESIFEDALDKLHGKWNVLSTEEEELIITLSKRF